LVTDVEATTLNKTFELTGAHASIVIEVTRVEGLIDIKAGLVLQALADFFRSQLCFEVHPPHISMLDLGVREEAIVAAVAWVSVV